MTVSPSQRVSRRRFCPICHHADYCYFSTDGHLVFCMRVSGGSVKQARNGAYIHRLDRTQTNYKPQCVPKRQTQPLQLIASIDQRDNTYRALLSSLELEQVHRNNLLNRGLSHIEIEKLLFRSTPEYSTAQFIANELSQRFDLNGVPGFYRERGVWQMVWTARGYFVPYCDERGLIQAMQYRLESPLDNQKYIWLSSAYDSKQRPRECGSSSGAPVHFARPELLSATKEVLITEGSLKSSVISYFTNQPVIAAAGVSCFGQSFAQKLRASFPHLLKTTLCFDADLYTNKQVADALLRLSRELERAYFSVMVRTWSAEDKGYDDYLAALHKSITSNGKEAA